jgi:TonB family protein
VGVFRLRSPFAISLVLHLLVLALLTFAMTRVPIRPELSRTTWIQLEAVPEQLLRPKKDGPASTRQRVVQTQRGQKVEEAAPNAFLGERTQVVERQTVARDRLTQIGRDEARARGEGKSQGAATAQKQRRAAERTPMPSLSQLGVPLFFRPSQTVSGQEQLARDRSVPMDGAGAPKDYVKGLREAESTALNTREFVFFGYFQRIRQRLDRAWSDSLRAQLDRFYRSGRQLASESEHTTRTLVTLDSAGEVVRVQLIEESGTRDLDEAAIKAFNTAGPFPNPPKGILDAEGRVQIRWDFVLRT